MCGCVCGGGCYLNWVDGGDDGDDGGDDGEADYLGAVRDMDFSSLGVGVVSRLGGIRSLIASRPLASANDVILWLGEKPCRAL